MSSGELWFIVAIRMGTDRVIGMLNLPGRYFLYTFNDINGGKGHLSNIYMSSHVNNIFILLPEGHVGVEPALALVIP